MSSPTAPVRQRCEPIKGQEVFDPISGGDAGSRPRRAVASLARPMAYVLLTTLRRVALAPTELAKATCGTIRLKLPKIGAVLATTVRRIKIAM